MTVTPYLLLPLRTEHQAAQDIAEARWRTPEYRAKREFIAAQDELDASDETELSE